MELLFIIQQMFIEYLLCASQWDTQEDKTYVVPKVVTGADKYYSDTCLFSLYV